MTVQQHIDMKVTKPMLVSAAFELVKLMATVLFYSLLARNVSPAIFGGYVLIRKIAAWFCPVATFGTYIGLSYYLPPVQGEKKGAEIISSSSILVISVLLIITVLLAIFPEMTLNLFFGEKKAGSWLGPLIAMIVVDALYQYVIAVKRGSFKITTLNIYKLIIVGFIPLAVILAYPEVDLRRLVFVIAAASLLVLIVPIVEIYVKWISKASFRGSITGLKTIWRYCFYRIPGDLLFMTFISCWLVLAAHLYDYNSVGYVSVGLNMIGALGIITVPFEIVLLPVMRRLQSIDTKPLSSGLVYNALQCSMNLAFYVALHVAVLAPFIIRWWLGGGEYANAAGCVRLMSPMLFGYILYVGNRHMADGMSTRPINTYLVAAAIAISLLLFSVGYYVFGIKSLSWMCVACSVGFVLLGFALVYCLVRHYSISLKIKDLVIAVLYSGISAFIVVLVRSVELSPYTSFGVVSSLEITLFLVYMYLLGKSGAVWARKMTQSIVSLVPTIKRGFDDRQISESPPGQ